MAICAAGREHGGVRMQRKTLTPARPRAVVPMPHLDAADSVPDVQEATGLATLAVHGQRVADGGLDDEAVEGGAEDAVIVQAVEKLGVGNGLLGLDAVHDALQRRRRRSGRDHPVQGQRRAGPDGSKRRLSHLVEVGGGHLPSPAGKVDVVRVVDLGEVVERAALLGVGQGVGPAGGERG